MSDSASTYFVVEGLKWSGAVVATCEHKHRTMIGAQACVAKMRKARIKGCETYKIAEVRPPLLTVAMRTLNRMYHEATRSS